jgi:hypothetical protein
LGFLLFPLPIFVGFLCHPSDLCVVNFYAIVRFPYGYLRIYGMVLHKGMSPHEFDRPVSLVGVIIRLVTFPLPYRWNMVYENAMRPAI